MKKYYVQIVGAFISAACVLVPSFAFAAFNTNLSYGSSGADVTSLQQFLVQQGLLSSVSVTGNFYSHTLSALEQFQSQEGITPASGYFGPLTRAKVDSLEGSASTAAVINEQSRFTSSASIQAEIQKLLAELNAAKGLNPSIVQSPLPATTTGVTTFTASPTSGSAPLSVGFYLAGVSDTSSSYAVNFGDGTTGSNWSLGDNGAPMFMSHVYSAGGYYTATVSHNGSVISTEVINVGLSDIATPTVVSSDTDTLTASPTAGSAPLTVSFTGTAHASSYSLNFGDGTPAFGTECSDNASTCGINSTHTYANAGNYTATLTDSNGTKTVAIFVGLAEVALPPVVSSSDSLSASPTVGGAPLTVSFTGTAHASSYSLNFGDGTPTGATMCSDNATSCGINTTHIYSSGGNYTATLSDSNGTKTVTISVGLSQ